VSDAGQGVNWLTTLLLHDVTAEKEARRLRRERRTVRLMVELFCSHHHGTGELCASCRELAEYADRRLDLCPYGADKPACTSCPIHCYRPEPRERMREVMRFAGPRMMRTHLYLAVMHLFDTRRPAPPLPAAKKSTNRSDSGQKTVQPVDGDGGTGRRQRQGAASEAVCSDGTQTDR
jgi:hypothetical protein